MEIQIFENEQFGQLRGMTIEGEPWFVGKDVAQVLGYKDASKAVCDRVDKEDKTTLPIQQCGSNFYFWQGSSYLERTSRLSTDRFSF